MTREEKLQAIREKCALARNPTATRSEIARYTISKQFGLCDVLLAIKEIDVEKALGRWNVRQDSLTDQSPETIDFIHSLLCV